MVFFEQIFHSINRLSWLFLMSLCSQKGGEGREGRKKRKSLFEKITLVDYKSWKLVCNFALGDQTANQECCQEQNGIPNKLAMSEKPIQHRIKAHKENKFIQPTLSEFLIMSISFSHLSLSSSTGIVWRGKNESHFINHLIFVQGLLKILYSATHSLQLYMCAYKRVLTCVRQLLVTTVVMELCVFILFLQI